MAPKNIKISSQQKFYIMNVISTQDIKNIIHFNTPKLRPSNSGNVNIGWMYTYC